MIEKDDIRQLGPEDFAKTFECQSCGHHQTVVPAVVEVERDGRVAAWFGSDSDFCQRCDGVVTEVIPTVH